MGWYIPTLVHDVTLSNKVENLNPVLPVRNEQSKYELVMVYIGCASCPASNAEGLPEALHEIRNRLSAIAMYNGYTLHTIGIAKDYIPTAALSHLAKYGFFDDILIGNDWSNLGILKYTYFIPGQAAVPQLVITERLFNTIKSGDEETYRGIKKEELILRKVGPDEIIAWAQNNAILPTDTFLE